LINHFGNEIMPREYGFFMYGTKHLPIYQRTFQVSIVCMRRRFMICQHPCTFKRKREDDL
jgi:hypothetical protein